MDAEYNRTNVSLNSQDPVSEFLELLPSLRSKETPKAKPWNLIVGTLPGDEIDDEAAKIGSEWRDRMNHSEFG